MMSASVMSASMLRLWAAGAASERLQENLGDGIMRHLGKGEEEWEI